MLLDEPTTGQDQKSLSDIKALLLYAASEGRTIFFCTHDIELAGELADQVFLLKEGRFLASGTPHTIFSDKKLMEEGGSGAPAHADIVGNAGHRAVYFCERGDGSCPIDSFGRAGMAILS